MAVYYLDTSALVKRYVVEAGSLWIRNLTDPVIGNRLYLVRIAGPEIIAVFFRKARGGQLTLEKARRAREDFRQDWEKQYRIVEITASLVDNAMAIAEKRGLRGYDAVHLAAASELHQNDRLCNCLYSPSSQPILSSFKPPLLKGCW
jgi:predicted nucleic acid-binding protein